MNPEPEPEPGTLQLIASFEASGVVGQGTAPTEGETS